MRPTLKISIVVQQGVRLWGYLQRGRFFDRRQPQDNEGLQKEDTSVSLTVTESRANLFRGNRRESLLVSRIGYHLENDIIIKNN